MAANASPVYRPGRLPAASAAAWSRRTCQPGALLFAVTEPRSAARCDAGMRLGPSLDQIARSRGIAPHAR